jgi:hypothetical protein
MRSDPERIFHHAHDQPIAHWRVVFAALGSSAHHSNKLKFLHVVGIENGLPVVQPIAAQLVACNVQDALMSHTGHRPAGTSVLRVHSTALRASFRWAWASPCHPNVAYSVMARCTRRRKRMPRSTRATARRTPRQRIGIARRRHAALFHVLLRLNAAGFVVEAVLP